MNYKIGFYVLLLAVIALFVSHIANNEQYELQKEYLIKEDSLNNKVDTFMQRKDSLIIKYSKSKELIHHYDTLYQPGKDSTCDSLVLALKAGIKDCDTINKVNDSIIVTKFILDTVKDNHIKYLEHEIDVLSKRNRRKLRIGGFIGAGINTDKLIRPTAGVGIVF